MRRPPRLAEALLRWALPDSVRGRSILGDAHEEFQEVCERRGAWTARLWFWGHTLRVTAHYALRPRSGGGSWTFGWLLDLRFAWRTAHRNPGFTAVAVLILALGIGANAALFSVARGVFLQAPPVNAPEDLVAVYTSCRRGEPRCSSSYPDYLDYRDQSSELQDLAGWTNYAYSVGEEGQPPERLTTYLVTGNYFELLGVIPDQGRLIQPADDDPRGPTGVAVVSHRTWVSRFGGDPGLVGRSIRVDGVPIQVVGIAPEGFRGTQLGATPDLFMPLTSGQLMGANAAGDPEVFETRGARWIQGLVGRLRPGGSFERLQSEMAALAMQLNETYPDERQTRTTTVDRLNRYQLPQFGREDLSRLVWILAAVVGGSLLLACANLANLLLARASARRGEVGMRIALGASRARVLRQLLTENVALALVGGLAGLAVARSVLGLLRTVSLPGGVVLGEVNIGLDWTVFGFALLLAGTTGIVFGLVPALRALVAEGGMGLRAETVSVGRKDRHLRRVLVGVQVAVSVVLLVGSGLFLRTLGHAFQTDLGFQPEGLAMARFDLRGLGYSGADATEFMESLRERLAGSPSVTGVSYASRIPMQSGGNFGVFAEVDGYVPAPDEEMRVEYVLAGPELFATLGASLIAGRVEAGGVEDPVAVVNSTIAERYWQGRSAVGGALSFGEDAFRVTAVSEDVHWRTVDESGGAYVVLPYTVASDMLVQAPVTMVARTSTDPASLLPLLRREALALEPGLTFLQVSTLEDLTADALGPQRLGAVVLSAFAALALLLATVGIGGVVAYSISRRRVEIGLRLALGASPGSVVRGIAADMILPMLLGVVAGLLAAGIFVRSLSTFLIGVEPVDVPTFAAVSGVIVVAGMAVTMAAARRAAGVDPMKVLKTE